MPHFLGQSGVASRLVNRELIVLRSNGLVIPARRARSTEKLGDELALRQLGSVPVFADSSTAEISDFAARSTEVRASAGAVLAVEDELVSEVILVLDGYAGAEAKRIPVLALGPGAVIGGPEALVGSLHPFSVIAQTPVVLRVVSAIDFAQIVAAAPSFATALIQQLGGRTRTVLNELVCARQGSVSPRAGAMHDLAARPSGARGRGRT